jgi:hypothetical protein
MAELTVKVLFDADTIAQRLPSFETLATSAFTRVCDALWLAPQDEGGVPCGRRIEHSPHPEEPPKAASRRMATGAD